MNIALLERRFGRIGARVKVGEAAASAGRAGVRVGRDEQGEYFDIRVAPGERVEYVVVDVRPGERHLLLMERGASGRRKFLCGRDESRWFVNAVSGRDARVASQTTRGAAAGSRMGRRLARIKSRLRRLTAH